MYVYLYIHKVIYFFTSTEMDAFPANEVMRELPRQALKPKLPQVPKASREVAGVTRGHP